MPGIKRASDEICELSYEQSAAKKQKVIKSVDVDAVYAVWEKYRDIKQATGFPGANELKQIEALARLGGQDNWPEDYFIFVSIWVREAVCTKFFSTPLDLLQKKSLLALCDYLSQAAFNRKNYAAAWNYFTKVIQLHKLKDIGKLDQMQYEFGLRLALHYFNPDDLVNHDLLAVFLFELMSCSDESVNSIASNAKYDKLFFTLNPVKFKRFSSSSPQTETIYPTVSLCYFDPGFTHGLKALPAAGIMNQADRHRLISQQLKSWSSSDIVMTEFSQILTPLPAHWDHFLALVNNASSAVHVQNFYDSIPDSDELKKLLTEGRYPINKMIESAVSLNNDIVNSVYLDEVEETTFTGNTWNQIIHENFLLASKLASLDVLLPSDGAKISLADLFHPQVYPFVETSCVPSTDDDINYTAFKTTDSNGNCHSPTFIKNPIVHPGDKAMQDLIDFVNNDNTKMDAIVWQLGLDSDSEDTAFYAQKETLVRREMLNDLMQSIEQKCLHEGAKKPLIITLEGGYNCNVLEDFFSPSGQFRDFIERLKNRAVPVYVHLGHPTHHAGEHGSSGFCYGNLAFSAASVLAEKGYHVQMIDTDINHGNGTYSLVKSLKPKLTSAFSSGM